MRASTLAVAVVLVARLAAQDAVLPARLWDTGKVPLELATGDLDLDGTTDYALLLFGSKVSVQLGQPGGGIGPPANKLLPTEPLDLAIGLLDGDALPDLVAASSLATSVSLVFGNGGGDFAAPQALDVGVRQLAVAVADLQGDGAGDLVVGEILASPTANGSVRAWLGDGAGGWAPGASATLPASFSPDQLLVGLLDGDAVPDLVVIAWTGAPAVLRGDGAGGFLPPVVLPSPILTRRGVLADLDADGHLDLATCGNEFPSFVAAARVYLGDGQSGFALQPAGVTLQNIPTLIAAADAGADGDMDLFTGSAIDADILTNAGAADFAAGQHVALATGNRGLAVHDATGDGLPDLVTLHVPGLAVHPGLESGSLLLPDVHDATPATFVLLADLDHDAAPDLLTRVEAPGPALAVRLGGGGWGPEAFYPVAGDGASADTGDVNGDGHSDVVASATSSVSALLGDGGGSFAPSLDSAVGAQRADELALEDLDLDGHLDVLVAGADVPEPYAAWLVVMAGDGTGAFIAGPPVATGGAGVAHLRTGDLDGDGLADAVVAQANLATGLIATLQGTGGLSLSAPQPWPIGFGPDSLALGDLDLDGALDVVVGDSHGEVAVLRGDGTGGLLPAVVHAADDSASSLDLSDLNGDGWLDVVVARSLDDAVGVLPNDGAGGLLPEIRFATFQSQALLAVADLDLDGRPDVVSTADGISGGGQLVDSRNATEPFTWTDLGAALPGTLGAPRLHGTGALLPGSPGDLRLFAARPSALAVLFVAATSAPAAFKGGTLVPVPPIAQLAVVTDAAGGLTLGWSAWPSASPGQDWFFQYGIADPAAVHGVALSNALKAVEP